VSQASGLLGILILDKASVATTLSTFSFKNNAIVALFKTTNTALPDKTGNSPGYPILVYVT